MTFPCIKCGLCCKQMGKIDRTYDRGDGTCVHLNEDHTCKIYETRPQICRIDKMKPNNLKKEEWYQINLKWCKELGAKI